MMWSSAYCFKVTIHQILAELNPFENFCYFLFPAKSSYSLHPIKLKLHKQLHDDVEQHILFRGYSAPNICRFMPLWSFCKLFAAYCLEVIVCQRLIWAYNIAMLLWCVLHQKALLPRSSKLLPVFPGGRSHLPWFLGQLWPIGYSISRDYAPMKFFIYFFFFFFFFFCNSTYSLYPEHWIIQESVYVLHLITCHGCIMPHLAELLLLLFFIEIPMNICPSETPGPIFFKLYVELSVKRGMNICTNGHGPFNKMVAMPIYGKTT